MIGKPNDDAQTGAMIEQFDRAMVKADYSRRQTKAETVARRRAAMLQPVEAPKNLSTLLLRDARPVVCDLGNSGMGSRARPNVIDVPGGV